jgi:aryl-alcohol dehydrogenase-like predicted oxidoreductase
VIQPGFSLLFQPFRSLIAWCDEQGIGVTSHGPLAFGLLGVTSETRLPRDDWRSPDTESPPVLALHDALSRRT